MRKICFPLLLGLSAQFAVGQSETVVVTGSRIPYESVGPISFSGPIDEGDHACAEPNCGQDPEDPSSGGYTNHASKNQRNKLAKQKVAAKPVAKKAVKATPKEQGSVYDSGFLWLLKQFNVTWVTEESQELENGKTKTIKDCVYAKFGEDINNPCVKRQIDVEKVQAPNGQIENQLLFSFIIYEPCYYEKKCGPDYITFVAGSMQELNSLLNEAIGENYF